MTDDSSKKLGLIAPKPLLRRLAWGQEARKGADESVDEPPLFSSSGVDFELDESLSVDFAWPSLSGSFLNEPPSGDISGGQNKPSLASARQQSLLNAPREKLSFNDLEHKLDLNQVPHQLVNEGDLVWQRLDHREGYIFSQVDGETSFAELIDIVGLPQQQTLVILNRLLANGLISHS